jgi:hypothetical protein
MAYNYKIHHRHIVLSIEDQQTIHIYQQTIHITYQICREAALAPAVFALVETLAASPHALMVAHCGEKHRPAYR